jgi:hypothetical protein
MWAWAQACLGHPEKGLTAAEFARRLNPRHPDWYDDYLARIVFLLGRYEQTIDILGPITSAAPEQHPLNMGWLTAAWGHFHPEGEAFRCAGWFVKAISNKWRGHQSAGPAEYVDWFIDVCCLRRTEDQERLRQGLKRAGLPA